MEKEFFEIIDDWLHKATWTDKIAIGMQLIASGCDDNKTCNNCPACPFFNYCQSLTDSEIPETWWH